ncbi:MAG TPA: translation elongation factor Ts [Candidatus Absconditabacterales bacterium]|nr:translation elongation factor Ts [Candidatus Absconditabacterales bacterium]HMT26745.1 translation elongation factor Ts [Candidatus Absconditabacterales bacterium]
MNIDLLKQLRELTNAPLKDCKDALTESNGDLTRAQEILREKGALHAAKKADRETNEGVVRFKKSGNGKILGIKIVCETDFVAKNDTFQQIVEDAINILDTSTNDVNSINELDSSIFEKIDKLIKDNIVKLGESIKCVDTYVKKADGTVYNHPGDKIASAIFFKTTNTQADSIAKDICLQIAAMNPEYLSVEQVPVEKINELKAKFMEEMAGSGKPQEIINNIIQGKLNKELSEYVLTEQSYIRDEAKKVKEIIPQDIELISFVRFAI